jgi:heme exporter protein D
MLIISSLSTALSAEATTDSWKPFFTFQGEHLFVWTVVVSSCLSLLVLVNFVWEKVEELLPNCFHLIYLHILASNCDRRAL